ncbi:MAG: CinA family protein [Bacilli bacterium]|nr:CinA family protein [Bacilli bacterium]
MNERAQFVLAKLQEKSLTLASVESVTGGLFGATITDIPGASKVYVGGIVCYSTELKKKLVGVDPAIIEKHGVVSQQVAVDMVLKARSKLKADIIISCTGNAGPDVEPDGKAVGRVCLGMYYNGYTWGIPLDLKGSREEIREDTVDAMLGFIASLFREVQRKK